MKNNARRIAYLMLLTAVLPGFSWRKQNLGVGFPGSAVIGLFSHSGSPQTTSAVVASAGGVAGLFAGSVVVSAAGGVAGKLAGAVLGVSAGCMAGLLAGSAVGASGARGTRVELCSRHRREDVIEPSVATAVV